MDAYQGWHSGRTGEPPNVESGDVRDRRTGRRRERAAFLLGIGVGGASGGSGIPAAAASAPAARAAPAQVVPAAPTAAPAAAPSPEPAKPAGIGEGEWLVGAEVEPGRYRSTGAKEGIFDLCSATTRSDSGDVIEWKTGKTGEQVLINVTRGAARFSHAGCEPFVKVG